MSLRNLLDPKTKVSVSATAPGTSRKAILNDSEEPWTGPSLPSHVHLTFPPTEAATHLALTFQGGSCAAATAQNSQMEGRLTISGGFVGTRTEVWTATDEELELAGSIYPEDKSRRQVFPIPKLPSGPLTQLKLVFTESSDNQGRITVYQVELLG